MLPIKLLAFLAQLTIVSAAFTCNASNAYTEADLAAAAQPTVSTPSTTDPSFDGEDALNDQDALNDAANAGANLISDSVKRATESL
jgi:hypothetical protein